MLIADCAKVEVVLLKSVSKEELARFRSSVNQDKELKAQLQEVKKKAKRDAIVSFALSKGFSVDINDFSGDSVE
jgi:hypothetical protein